MKILIGKLKEINIPLLYEVSDFNSFLDLYLLLFYSGYSNPSLFGRKLAG